MQLRQTDKHTYTCTAHTLKNKKNNNNNFKFRKIIIADKKKLRAELNSLTNCMVKMLYKIQSSKFKDFSRTPSRH